MAASRVKSRSVCSGSSETAINSAMATPSAARMAMDDSILISRVRFWPQYWLPRTIMPPLTPKTICWSTN